MRLARLALVALLSLALVAGLCLILQGAPAQAGVSARPMGPAVEAAPADGPSVRTPLSETWCVHPLGTGGCYTNVQAAVEAARPGDEIRVATGVYTGAQARPAPAGYEGPAVVTQVVYLSKTLTIRGGYSQDFANWNPDAYPTTLDAQGGGRVLLIAGPVSPTLEGLRLVNGDATGLRGRPFEANVGGGVYAVAATVTFSACRFYENIASTIGSGYGGGGYLHQSSVVMVGNEVISNVASAVYDGGGGGLCFTNSSVVMNDNMIQNNVANNGEVGIGWGGGVYLIGTSVTLAGNVLLSNTASVGEVGWGGGVYLVETSVTLTGNVLLSNTASVGENGRGGGLYSLDSSAMLNDNLVRGNIAAISETGMGSGGGLYFSNCPVVLNANVVEKNIASGNYSGEGGGIFIWMDAGISVTLLDNLVRDNVATANPDRAVLGNGGGILLDSADNALLRGNVVVNNVGLMVSGKPGYGGGIYVAGQATLVNNLVADNAGKPEGAGLYVAPKSSVRLLHNTFARNVGRSGIYLDGSGGISTVRLTNTILISHSVGIRTGSSTTATLEATLWGNGTDWDIYDGAIITGDHNYWGDPDFGDSDRGDYHLGPHSAALDVGIDAGVGQDIDGQARPGGLGYDLGADEYYPCYPLTGLSIAGPSDGHPGVYTFSSSYQPPTASLPIDYLWDDGGTLSATVRELEAGVHSLILTATNCPLGFPPGDVGATRVTATHVVNVVSLCDEVTDVHIAGPGIGNLGVAYRLTATVVPSDADPPLDYTWWPTPTSGQGKVVTYTWGPGQAGLQTVAVTVTNCAGDGQASDAHTIILVEPPVCVELTGVDVTGPLTGTTGVSYTFSATPVPSDATGPITYTWGASGQPETSGQRATISYTWGTSGPKGVTVTAENCGDTPVVAHATIRLSPPCYGVGGVSVSGPVTAMVGTSSRFSAQVSPGTASLPISYTWTPEPAAGQGTDQATYLWRTVGPHSLAVAAENCSPGSRVSATWGITVESVTVYLPLVLRGWPRLVWVDDAPDACPGYPAEVGWSYRENFDLANDNDWFTFDAVAGQTYVLETRNLGPEADTVLYLYGPDCQTWLAENDDRAEGDPSSLIEWTATETGVLAAMVRSFNWELYGPDTGYTLSIGEQ